eukprot:76177_1
MFWLLQIHFQKRFEPTMSFLFEVFTIMSIAYFNTISGNIPPICPTIPVHTGSQIDHSSLDSSCFAIDMTLNVENILPDPSYISPSSNWDIINNALTKTLNNNQINGFTITNGISSINENWSVNNQQYNVKCPDNKDNTINKLQFKTRPYNMLCNDNTLNIYQNMQKIECQFIMPQSIIYTWNLQSIESLIDIVNINTCQTADLQAIIGEMIYGKWEILSQSNILTITPLTSNTIQQFVFNNPIILKQDTIYSLIISVKNCISMLSVKSKPLLLTNQQPNPCQLGNILANDNSMKFGLESLCDSNNSIDSKRQHFEDIFYQQHSSQTLIENYLSLSRLRRRLIQQNNNIPFSADIPSVAINKRTLLDAPTRATPSRSPSGCSSCPTSNPARRLLPLDQISIPEPGFKVTLSNSSSYLLAPQIIFPCIKQCIAIDSYTKRIFSVGGIENGQALNRLKIYLIKSQKQIEEININLSLDKPRYGSMCYYYKHINGREYIIVINGMSNVNDINNNNLWYNDIVFIPLDPSENRNMIMNNVFPNIELQYNVIDMKPYINEANELWLFGGRDGINAKNYIQSIDLNKVYNNYEESRSAVTSVTENILTMKTLHRMEPMVSDLVLPFTDYIQLNDFTCIMIVGGQNYVDNEWINIDIPLSGLQLYCNNNINQGTLKPPYIYFTEFDKTYLEKVNNFEAMNGMNNIYMTEYEFENNNIWYEFNVSMKVCSENNYHLMNAFDMFNNNQRTNAILAENILMNSQTNYNGWNHGYGNVYISNIDVFKNENQIIN